MIDLINDLKKKLEAEIIPNPENQDSIALLNRSIYTKHEAEVRKLRKQSIVESKRVCVNKGELAAYSDFIRQGKHQTDLILENTNIEYKKLRKQKVDSHSFSDTKEGPETEEDENLLQLKQRLLQGHNQNNHKVPEVQSFDKKLQIEESKQEDLLKDMFQFVQGIKEGADAFNQKMNEDQNILKAAEAGLNITSAKIQKSKNDLSKTINNLGLLDFLKIFGAIILLFLLSLIIIKIFPTW